MARNGLAAITLAAGYGKIDGTPKLLMTLGTCTLIERAVHLLNDELDIYPTVVVDNDESGDALRKVLGEHASLYDGQLMARQNGRRGTAGAVELALERLASFGDDFSQVLVTYADMPLLRPETLAGLVDNHRNSLEFPVISMFSVDTACIECPENIKQFGRIIRNTDGMIIGIREPFQMDAESNALWQQCQRVNPSVWIFDVQWLRENIVSLPKHDKGDGFPQETWLPDLVPMAVEQGRSVLELSLNDHREVLGVNNEEELLQVQQLYAEMYLQKA